MFTISRFSPPLSTNTKQLTCAIDLKQEHHGVDKKKESKKNDFLNIYNFINQKKGS